MSNINKTIYDAIKPHVENDKLTKEDAYKTKINTQKNNWKSFSTNRMVQ